MLVPFVRSCCLGYITISRFALVQRYHIKNFPSKSQSSPWNLIFHQTIFHLLQALQRNKLVHNLEIIVIVPSCHLAVQCLGGRVHTAHPTPRPILVQVCRRATLVVWRSRCMPVCNSIRRVREE